MELLDRKACYRAFQGRDARFDGRVFVGVTSTGIYRRPVCPARTPKFSNCRFFASAAAAQEAGFRPCLRCRPETAPDLAFWRGTSNTVSRALALIADGALDDNGSAGCERGVEALAERLGVGGRQLRRLFKQHLGASPIAVAQTRRVLFAKQLIHETRLPMVEVAMAAGFGSVRRFNETFHDLFQRPPSALRRKSQAALPDDVLAEGGVTLRLSYRPPYDWPAMLAHLQAHAVMGIETIEDGVYRRVIEIDGKRGSAEIANLPARNALSVNIRFPSVRALPVIVARIPPRLRPRRRYRHHWCASITRPAPRTLGEKASWPARARRLGRRPCRRAGRRRQHARHGSGMAPLARLRGTTSKDGT